jgi:rSAM/selenodomain-associated transferase 1
MTETIAIAILAKAPQPGFAKTRLIPALGAAGAAALQARMAEHAVATACESGVGPVTVWAAPDPGHAFFQGLSTRFPIALARQPDGDLGRRMLAAVTAAAAPAIVIGVDCPALTANHLRAAANALRGGRDAVVIPAEDGGYVLIGLAAPRPEIFTAMRWSTGGVMDETRRRFAKLDLAVEELAPLWDVDRGEDLDRLRAIGWDILAGAD